ncbi:MAG: ribosome small subunit-dependent GTPase A [Flavobacteriales bacterium]|nr:ribosome small subunit-dependent GTPase A [Flavobacteriales bacterium]
MEGIVVKSTGNVYDIIINNNVLVKAYLQGRLRLENNVFTNPVVVGDRVSLNKEGQNYFINKIFKRKNFIVRKSVKLSKTHQMLASNIDQVLLIVTLVKPFTSTKFIDRFLASAEVQGIQVILVFNKTDLYNEELKIKLEYIYSLYNNIGYKCIKSSFINDDNKNILSLLNNKITLISGHSGVGKSSLINYLSGNNKIKVSEISEHYELGKHTTTFSEMHKLGNQGFVIDTPGIKGFGLVDLSSKDLAYGFKEFVKYKTNCRFKSCVCVNEPDCGVKNAVKLDKISKERYLNYLSILNEDNFKTRKR